MPIPRRLLRLVFLFRGRSEDDDEPTRAFRNIVVVKSRKLLINERSTSANKIITRDKVIV